MSRYMQVIQEVAHGDPAGLCVDDPETVLNDALEGTVGWMIREKACTCGCGESRYKFWIDGNEDDVIAALKKRSDQLATTVAAVLETDFDDNVLGEKMFLDNLIELIPVAQEHDGSIVFFS